MTRKKEERVVAWHVEDCNTGEYWCFGYRSDARDKAHDLVQAAMDEGLSDRAAAQAAELKELVFHDSKAAGELRRLRSFVHKVKCLEYLAIRCRQTRRWALLSDEFNTLVGEAKQLAKKGKKR